MKVTRKSSAVNPDSSGKALDTGDAREPESVGEADLAFNPANLDTTPPASASDPPDPFADLAELRLSQDLAAAAGVQEVLTTVPHRKPAAYWWFRVHPDPAYHFPTSVVELKEDSEVYLVLKPLWPSLIGEPTFSPRIIYPAITAQGLLFLWLCRLPGPDGKMPDYIDIPLQAARQATSKWTRLFWDQAQRRHRLQTAATSLGEPQWPDRPFLELLHLSFKDHIIKTADHPVLRRLRGEV